MNTTDQVIVLAKLDGWNQVPSGLVGECEWYQKDCCWLRQINLPNYLHSRYAIVPLIEKQSHEVKVRVGENLPSNNFDFLATDAQPSEALLRALNLWEE